MPGVSGELVAVGEARGTHTLPPVSGRGDDLKVELAGGVLGPPDREWPARGRGLAQCPGERARMRFTCQVV